MKKPFPFTLKYFDDHGRLLHSITDNAPSSVYSDITQIATTARMAAPKSAVRVVIDIALPPTEVASHA